MPESVAEKHVMPHYEALMREATPGRRSDGPDPEAAPERSIWHVTASGRIESRAVEAGDNG